MFEKIIRANIFYELLNKGKTEVINKKICSTKLDLNELIDIIIREAQLLFFPLGLLSGILISIIIAILLMVVLL